MGDFDELLGDSPATATIRDHLSRLLVRRPDGRRVPALLIHGETGTGKGLVARLVHRHGPRASGPFVDVNCAAIPDTLLEAELFGFERGAFTDARRSKPGLFQSAHRGTIFLDEIGLLPAALQAKLLKVLEERMVRRLGSTTSEPADVWVVSATNADLQQAVRQQRFREDLYHRLAVITLYLPPLRERGRDALLLAERFLSRACADYGLSAKRFSPAAQERLLAYPWPGNVREVANVAERVALLVEGEVVDADDLELSSVEVAAPASEAGRPAAGTPSLDDAIRMQLQAALTQTGWNISRTATLLDISRNTVRARIQKYGLREGSDPAPPVESSPRTSQPRRSERRESATGPTRVRWEPRRLTLLQAELVAADEHALPVGSARELDALTEKVRSFGGHVDELSQSGLRAVFGLEPAEDTPQRAAKAALTIEKALERMRAEEGSPFSVKLAIHTGRFLVTQLQGATTIDSAARQEAGPVLASLLGQAEPGTTVVSPAARPFLERRFEVERMGRDPEAGYRLLGHEPHGLGVAGRMTSFVGREHELEMLQSRLAAAMTGQRQLVAILGDAGIGKSRLLFEFRRRAAQQGVGYIEGRCVSYGGAIPYLPVVDLIQRSFRLTEADGSAAVTQKIRAGLRVLGLQFEESGPFLLNLLGFKEGTDELTHLSAQAVKTRTFDVLRRIVLRANEMRPMIVAVEDLHWIDRSSEDLFNVLVDSLAGAPILLVCTYRPGYQPRWIAQSATTQIALPPLSSTECLTLAESMMPNRRLPAPLTQIILSRAEGNPFFLEEITRTLAERGEAAGDLAVPDTVQGVLMARIERLPDDAKRLLQIAAVLGRVASGRVLEAVWGESPRLSRSLRELERLEFVYERPAGEDSVYSFKHALIQEVAYSGLLEAQRRDLHLAAARAIEDLNRDRLDDVCDSLAYHYARTGEAAKAVEYLMRSADKAGARHAHVEAVAALEAALARVPDLAPQAQDLLTLQIVLRLTGSLTNLGRFSDILHLLAAHEAKLERVPEPRLAGLFHFQAGLIWSFIGDNERSEGHARKALQASEQAGDRATMGKAHYVLALAGVWLGRPQEVITHGTAAVGLLEGTGERYWLGLAHWILGLNYALVGRFESALAEESQASEIGADMADPRLLSYADWAMGTIQAFMGEAERGIEACQRSLERSPDPFNTATALGFLGFAYLESGRPAEAIRHLERAVELFRNFQYRHAEGLFTAYLSDALYFAGDLDRARRVAEEWLARDTSARFLYGVGLTRRLLGRVATAEGALPEAAALLAQAREVFVSIDAPHEVGRTELALAELARARDQIGLVREHASRARALFRQLGVPKYVERTERLAAGWGVALPAEENGPVS